MMLLVPWFAVALALMAELSSNVQAEPDAEPKLESSAAIYVRTDTDRTQVVSPVATAKATIGERNHIELTYAVDVWTSASIDVRTSATGRVREQRDEIRVGYDHTLRMGTVGLSYRFSHEPDYLSNSGTLSATTELRDKSIALELALSAGGDIVGRSGDPAFSQTIGYFDLFSSYTHVLTRATLLRLATQVRYEAGYLSSPYRWVSLGGGGLCAHTAGLCVPEQHPSSRVRMAAVGTLRQALSRRFSLGGSYRLYGDTWGTLGHTGVLDLRARVHPTTTVGLEQRAHSQGAASFYRAAYGEQPGGFVTRDRELSPLWNTRTTLFADIRVPTRSGADLLLGVLLAGGAIGYRDFVGLDRVAVAEATLQLGVAL